MRRIVIVDDDATLRIGLKTLVDWPQYGYEIVGEATDGAQGLTLIRELKPDIVITDMKMPKMNGAQLIRALKKEAEPPAVIALSGYDEYALVREAMKYGAADYLLKLELSPQLLLDTLSDAAPEHAKTIDRTPQADQGLLRTRVLRDLVANFYLQETELRDHMQAAGIVMNTDRSVCLLIKVGDAFRFEEVPEEEYHTLKFSVINIVEEIAGEALQAYCIENKTGEFYVLGCVRKELMNVDREALVTETAERIRDMLREYLDIVCTIGIGLGDGGIAGLQEARKQAFEAVRLRFSVQDSDIILRSHCPVQEIQSKNLTGQMFEIKHKLLKGLSGLDTHIAQEAFADMRGHLKYLRGREELFVAALELIGALHEFCDRCGIKVDQVLQQSGGEVKTVFLLTGYKDFTEWLNTLEQDILAYLERENKKGYQSIVNRVQKIVQERFKDELTLQEVADELHVTPGYLSTLMKKYTGKTFVECITDTRLKIAKEKLTKTDWKVYEIAEQVGYQDQFYFSRIFKRVTGVSPAEFRKRYGGEA